MINKKNIPLYIALAVPVLMILLVAAFIYFPDLGKHPKYNFVYMTGSDVYYYDYGHGYQVNGGRLVSPSLTNYNQPEPHFYIYDVEKNVATEVTLNQAQNYSLDPTNTSSDGYTVQRGNGGGGDFFFGGGGYDYDSWFIKGHNRAVKLNLKLTGSTYSNFRFLGWVE